MMQQQQRFVNPEFLQLNPNSFNMCQDEINQKFSEMRRNMRDGKFIPTSPPRDNKDMNTKKTFLTYLEIPRAAMEKIMKSDPDVKKISEESAVILSKACEMFITELTLKGWYSEPDREKVKTLTRSNLCAAVARGEKYNILIDTIPKKDLEPHDYP